MVLGLIGLPLVIPLSLPVLFTCWCWLGGVGRRSEVWWVVPHCVLLVLCWERNMCVFDDRERPVVELSCKLFFTLFGN